jgi:hypothetical protein
VWSPAPCQTTAILGLSSFFNDSGSCPVDSSISTAISCFWPLHCCSVLPCGFQAVDEALVTEWVAAPLPGPGAAPAPGGEDAVPSPHDHMPFMCTGINSEGECAAPDWGAELEADEAAAAAAGVTLAGGVRGWGCL